MLSIAVAIKDQGKYVPLMLIHWGENHSAIETCLERNIGYVLHHVTVQKTNSQSSNQRTAGQSTARSIAKRIKRSFFVQLIYYLLIFAREKRAAKRLLAKYSPACILTVGDRHVGIETAIIAQANDIGIPSIIIPFALSDQISAVAYRLAQAGWESTYGMRNVINRWLTKTKPEWVHAHEQNRLLWNSPGWMLAAHILGILPANPWNLGGGRAWKMALESEQARGILVREGLNPKKAVVVGKPRYDGAAEIKADLTRWRKEICQALELDPEKPLLLCSVPQLAEHDLLPWDEHWEEIKFLFQGLASAHRDLNVILSLHPKSDLNQYLPLASEYGHTIATAYSYDQLIPICDVFVATFSSTLTLAIVSEKPCLVIDFDWFGYDTFDDVPGVVVVGDRAQFVPALQRLFSDRSYYAQLVAGLTKSAPYWGRFDGKATDRVLDLIDEYILRGEEIRKLPKSEQRKALPPWSQ